MTYDADEVFTAVKDSFSNVELENSLDGVISRGRRIRGRRRALAGAAVTGMAGVAAVTALAIALPPSGPGADGRTANTSAIDLSGRQVLLAAAHQAESASTTGKYWHVRTDVHTTYGKGVREQPKHNLSEIWTTRDGQAWFGWRRLTGSHAGTAGVTEVKGSQKFTICDKGMTYKQVATLPTDPSTLQATLVKAMKNNDDAPVPAAAQSGFVTDCLSQLLADVPASPKVRAAAYRALAESPNATVTGKTTDPAGRAGIGIMIKGWSGQTTRLVIDPKTSVVLSREASAVYEGHGVAFTPKPKIGAVLKSTTWVYSEVGWTDVKPHTPAVDPQ